MVMNRREALKQVAFLMGGTLSAYSILGIEKGYCADASASGKGRPSVFNTSQMQLVSRVTDIIIPRTDTPGATDVGVPGFIDLMLRDVYAKKDRDRYMAGLAEFEAAARSDGQSGFASLKPAQQVELVKKFHDAAVIEERRRPRGKDDHPHRPFILMTKELTLLGFFTSQVGATQVLQYAAVPGSFHACIPLTQAGSGKSWAVEPGIEF
jgi:glucoside 3-dehydrogenase (cytochrome c) hitch-hiker subunit